MRSSLAAAALVLTCNVTGGLLAAAQDQLPDAPGKDQVVNVCGKCHEPQRVASLRLTREGWEEVVAKNMTEAQLEGTTPFVAGEAAYQLLDSTKTVSVPEPR